MNTSAGSLFRLVQSMSVEEQQELESSLYQKTETHYLILFKHLKQLAIYNEKHVKKELSKQIPAASFPVVKNILREKILRYLLTRQPESGTSRIHKLLDEVEVLFHRQLYVEAGALCDKIEKEALRHDHKHFLLEVNRWRAYIIQRSVNTNRKQQLNRLRENTMQVVDRMKQVYELGNWYSEIMAEFSQHPNLRNKQFQEKVHSWMKHPFFQYTVGDKKLGFYGNAYLAMAKNVLFKMNGQFEKSYEMERYVWQQFKNDWAFYYKYKREEVTATMCNFLEAISKTNHEKERDEHLQFVAKVLSREEKGNLYIKAYYMAFKLDVTVRKFKERLTAGHLAEFESFYPVIQRLPFLDFIRVYESYLSSAYYYMEQYDKAVEMQLHIVNSFTRADVRPDILEYARTTYYMYWFTSIIAHKRWSDKEISGFVPAIKTYSELVRKKPADDDYRMEAILTELFRKLQPTTSRKTLLGYVRKCGTQLNRLFANPSPCLTMITVHFDYQEWLNRCEEYLTN